MMGLRSTTEPASAGDTSLVTPSDKDLSTGQQRVLNQVNTIKRGKSKYKNGTTSPTTPAPTTSKTSDFGQFKFRAASTYSRSNSSGQAVLHNRKSRSLTTKSMKGRLVGTNMEQVSTSSLTKIPNGLKPSRSDPALTSARLASAPSMKARGQSQTNAMLGSIRVSQNEQSSMVNSTGNMQDDLTLHEALEYLGSPNESYQQCGASYIQHICFRDESVKDEVFRCNGIPQLVNMLDSEKPNLQRAASGALRNLVFKHNKSKMEVQKSGGIAKILNQMKKTKSTETQRQLAGLLWNLSSVDELRSELTSTALIALTKNVVVPFSIPKDDAEHVDPDVFYFATGCLRNLSSGSSPERQKMRECKNLIEALVTYISSCEKEGRLDDKPVENCVCTLHNLTFQLWQECPEASYSAEVQSDNQEGRKSPTVGCFSPRSRKAKEEMFSEAEPQDSEAGSDEKILGSEVKWLYNSKATDVYFALLKSSKNNVIKEASCGAMQNLTASNHKGSVAVSEHLLNQILDNYFLSSLLRSKVTQKTYASLLDNMSRKPSLQSKIAPKVLPELQKILTDIEWQKEAAPDSVATVCKILPRLLLIDRDLSKKTMTPKLITALQDLSSRDPKNVGSIAASKLLHNLWTDKCLRTTIKHLKFEKFIYVNPITIDAIRDSTP